MINITNTSPYELNDAMRKATDVLESNKLDSKFSYRLSFALGYLTAQSEAKDIAGIDNINRR